MLADWMFRRRQVVSYKRLRRSFVSAAVQRSRRLSGHTFLAGGSESASRSECNDHLLPGEGRAWSSAAAAQVRARAGACQDSAQGKPKTGSILLDTLTDVEIILRPSSLLYHHSSFSRNVCIRPVDSVRKSIQIEFWILTHVLYSPKVAIFVEKKIVKLHH